jgi:Flp pilus assembly protein TadG
MRKLNQKGSVLVFLTLAFALLGTFVGFALDFGRAYLEKARIARLVDAAALAAAKTLQGQTGLKDAATRSACDSMVMNGAPVVMVSSSKCAATTGAKFGANVDFVNTVPGGPPILGVQVTGAEPVPTTFLRFLGFMVPGDFSTINVVAAAQAAPQRPVDLMLVLDRSGSMNTAPAGNNAKITDLRTAVNAFLNLPNTFTSNDRIGLVSFATRGCGSNGSDSTAASCTPDAALDFATSSYLTTLKNRVNGLCGGITNCVGGTNTMEALQTARPPLAASFNDASRAATRKAVLLVTDGQPTFMRRDTDAQCKQNPKNNSSLSNLTPSNGCTNAGGGPFTNGCTQGVPTIKSGGNLTPYMFRSPLNNPNNCLIGIPGTYTSTSCTTTAGSSNAQIYQDVIRCTRGFPKTEGGDCETGGAMHEANLIRNCGFNNSACAAGGEHDIVFFAIVIGKDVSSTDPQSSADDNAKCMLARMANATDILNAATGIVEKMKDKCNVVFKTTLDQDDHLDLKMAWPTCAPGEASPCIDPASIPSRKKVKFTLST